MSDEMSDEMSERKERVTLEVTHRVSDRLGAASSWEWQTIANATIGQDAESPVEVRVVLAELSPASTGSVAGRRATDCDWFCISPDGISLFPFDNESEAMRYGEQTGTRVACVAAARPMRLTDEEQDDLLEWLSVCRQQYAYAVDGDNSDSVEVWRARADRVSGLLSRLGGVDPLRRRMIP